MEWLPQRDTKGPMQEEQLKDPSRQAKGHAESQPQGFSLLLCHYQSDLLMRAYGGLHWHFSWISKIRPRFLCVHSNLCPGQPFQLLLCCSPPQALYSTAADFQPFSNMMRLCSHFPHLPVMNSFSQASSCVHCPSPVSGFSTRLGQG